MIRVPGNGPTRRCLHDGYVHLLFWDQRFGSQGEIFYKTNRVETGLGEQTAGPARARPLVVPTVASGVIRLLGERSAWMVDAVGRKVLPLKPGLNDVSHVAEGVYFVRLVQDQPAHKLAVRR